MFKRTFESNREHNASDLFFFIGCTWQVLVSCVPAGILSSLAKSITDVNPHACIDSDRILHALAAFKKKEPLM